MNRLESALCAAALTACGMASPTTATAADMTLTFDVQLDVRNVCFLTKGGDVDFGSMTATGSGQAVVANGSLIVRCNLPTSYAITLDQGLHGTGVGDRKMADGTGETIDYQLYSGSSGDVVCDVAGGAQWGDGSGGSCIYSATNLASDQTIQIQGTSILDNPVAGTYSDIITATITY